MVRNSKSYEKEMKKGLYLVPTPIGNMSDITIRAIDTLKNSDYILCEDTRISKNLLNKYDVKSKIISNHKFNEKKNISKLINILKTGAAVSLISDAGTPTISDPGSILINECVKNNINIFPLPGPSSVSLAISISGFSEKFFFYGFFPEKQKILKEDLKNLSLLNSSLVFFVSPNKFKKIIPHLKENFPDRKILICREMTKYFEEYIRTEVNIVDKVKFELRGELTIVISENLIEKKTSQSLSESDKNTISEMIKKFTIKEITNLIHKNSKVSKKEVYNYCLKLKNEN